MFFEFENPKLTRRRQVTLSIPTFFSKECTEEQDFQEVFDHYRINVFFALLYLASGCRSCKALQNRFWNSCGWPWSFCFLQCQIYWYETQFTTMFLYCMHGKYKFSFLPSFRDSFHYSQHHTSHFLFCWTVI